MEEMQFFEMTQAGYNKLKEELEYRKFKLRDEIAERIKVAISYGDLSENNEYTEAKIEQGENENLIIELEKTLKYARIIQEEKTQTHVRLGSTILLLDESSGQESEYTLVNAREEDIFEGKISVQSPVGAAVMDKVVGSVVSVKTPMGQLSYKILRIGTKAE